jgi:GNAT superfamily N-acetyltransferase
MTTSTLTARPARRSEIDTVPALCLAAFADEAVTAWVIADPDAPLAAMQDTFTASLVAAVEAEALIVAVTGDDDTAGASIWLDQDGTSPGNPMSTGDDQMTRRLALVRSLTTARHPRVPHVYLAAMAARPQWRGLGAGTAMLRYGLDRARRLGLPAYLEASTPQSRKLYARNGFVDHGPALPLPDGGPVLQPMWHDA